MGCCGGDRESLKDLRTEQKWEYINLDDFRSSSCWAGLAYGYLWIMLFVSLSVYAVDTFTAINLLAFDRWAGQIKPAIPLNISRWIFAGCIILSFVLLIYRWIRAVRVIKQGGVAKSYLDPLAARVQSIRMGKEGRGWRRFLVFAELTKSRKGADYVALFTYFSFEAWLRIVFAEGPRQVVNAITLYSVMRLNLIPEGDHAAKDGHSPIIQFFVNVGILADSDRLQAVILFGMLWTLVIWVISLISLMVSVTLYLTFLWHHIPTGDGGLTGYCRNKINRRMERIVQAKVDKALKKENELRARQEAKALRDGGIANIKKQPTLPNVDTIGPDPPMGISRQTTMTTLPEYSSQTQIDRKSNESVHDVDNHFMRPPPMRTNTDASWSSNSSHAPLVNSAADMGYAYSERSHTPGSTMSGPFQGRPGPGRSLTGQYSQRSYNTAPSRTGTPQSGWDTPGAYAMEPIHRPGTVTSHGSRTGPSIEDELGLPYPEERGIDSTYPMSTTSSRGPSWDSPEESQSRRIPANASGSYFPSIPETNSGRNSPAFDEPLRPQLFTKGPSERSYTPYSPVDEPVRSQAPSGGPYERSYTPAGQPPNRSHTPAGQMPTRSYTPAGPPSRSMTPGGPPPNRSMTPGGGQPPVPRYPNNNYGYSVFPPESRSTTPASVGGPEPTYRSYSRNEDRTAGNRPALYGQSSSQSGYPGPRGMPSRQGSGRNDILDHY